MNRVRIAGDLWTARKTGPYFASGAGRHRVWLYFLFLFFLNFLFYIGVQLINNVVLVSGVQRSDSVTHVHVSLLFQILFLFRLLHNTEQSSLCYIASPCWLSILNTVVRTCQSQTL